jgi:hypothetical protein
MDPPICRPHPQTRIPSLDLQPPLRNLHPALPTPAGDPYPAPLISPPISPPPGKTPTPFVPRLPFRSSRPHSLCPPQRGKKSPLPRHSLQRRGACHRVGAIHPISVIAPSLLISSGRSGGLQVLPRARAGSRYRARHE